MKLIECHIVGFGAFKDYTLSLSEGLNVVLQPNGWGKTTLSAFIKAMLYGFERKRVRDVSENERLRYKPWNGGKYGGTLDFEFNGVEYRVARTFGDTASSDTLLVVDIKTGKKVDLEGSEVGQWVFGLDAAAFQKTVFVAGNGFSIEGSTSSLRTRLNMLVSESSDIAMLDKAHGELDKRRKYYKKSGSRGYIADVSTQISKVVERKRALDASIGQLDGVHGEILEIDGQLAQVSDSLSHTQDSVDAAVKGEKETAALKAAHDQLEDRKRKAQAAYDSFSGKRVPGLDVSDQIVLAFDENQLQTVRDAYGTSVRVKSEMLRENELSGSLAQQREQIVAKRGGELPGRDAVTAQRNNLADLAHKQEVVHLAAPVEPEGFQAIAAAVSSDPGLLERVDGVVNDWPSASEAVSSLEDARRGAEAAKEACGRQVAEISELRKSLDEARREAAQAKESCGRCDSALALLGDADNARQSLADEIVGLRSRIDSAADKVASSGAEASPDDGAAAGSAEGSLSVEEACAQLEAGAKRCRADNESLVQARDNVSQEERELSKLNDAKLAAEAKEASAARASLAAHQQFDKAKSAYSEAEQLAGTHSGGGRKQASNAASSDQKSGKGSKSGAYALMGLGAAALICAVICFLVLGPSGMIVGAGAGIVGVALLVGGALASSKASAARADQDAAGAGVDTGAAADAGDAHVPEEIERDFRAAQEAVRVADADRDSAQAELQNASLAYEKQIENVSTAREILQEVQSAAASNKKRLSETAEGLFQGESFDPESIAVQVPMLIDRLAARDADRKELAEMKGQLEQKQHELEQLLLDLKNKLTAFGFNEFEDIASARNQLVAKKAADSQKGAKEAEALDRFIGSVAKCLEKKPEECAGCDVESLMLSVNQAVAKRCEAASAEYDGCQETVSRYMSRVAEASQLLGIQGSSNVAVTVERLAAVTGEYRNYVKTLADSRKENEQILQEIESLTSSLNEWARHFGLHGLNDLTDEWFDSLIADINAYEKLGWDIAEHSKKVSEVTKELGPACAVVDEFVRKCGISDADRVPEVIDSITRRLKEFKQITSELAASTDALASWEAEHASDFDPQAAVVDQDGLESLKGLLAELRTRQKELVAKRAQALERRDNLLGELECYYDCVQELKLLADSKQSAAAKLFTVQKTASLLDQARINLDKKYLGGLTDRFNDYVEGLLENEQISVDVDGNFNVSVNKGGAGHDVAAYSTGYQDMLDICLRMALVDTVFEIEAPFVVMDDPFVNLDQDKVKRAITLLTLLAQSRQIVYFTCHPSRIIDGAVDSQVAFTLPERRASRELPAARAKREAEERARAQRELVASYHIAPVTQGRASVKVLGNRTISNNMFTIRLDIDDASGTRDNAFEAFFIDENGCALCERQSVEVMEGCVVPDRLRFCLSTREDSGDVYDLIIHEVGRDESELAVRDSFTSKIAFDADDFGF